LALGLLLTELVAPEIAACDRPLDRARGLDLGGPLGAIVTALLAPSPAARPDAAWVAETAGEVADGAFGGWRARVAASYLRARRRELVQADAAHDDLPPAIHAAVATLRRLRTMCDTCGAPIPSFVGSGGRLLEGMDVEARQ